MYTELHSCLCSVRSWNYLHVHNFISLQNTRLTYTTSVHVYTQFQFLLHYSVCSYTALVPHEDNTLHVAIPLQFLLITCLHGDTLLSVRPGYK